MLVPLATGVTKDADDTAIVANITGHRSPIAGPVPAAVRVPRETKIVDDLAMLSKN
jgi:hypothetical protein